MCTALSLSPLFPCFGRTLDLEQSCGEELCLCPRNFPLPLRRGGCLSSHLALLGVARVEKRGTGEDFPLFFDAMNEAGLAMAGLNFPESARYWEASAEKANITPFELIPYILGQAEDLEGAKALLEGLSLYQVSFSESLPLTPLHWMLSDSKGALVLESTKEGIRLYEAPVGVMTNEPPFPRQMLHLSNFMGLSPKARENRAFPELSLAPHSQGTGAMGLPGDFSSMSRFVRAAFLRAHLRKEKEGEEGLRAFFHILESLQIPKGAVRLSEEKDMYTVYTVGYELKKGLCFVKSYEDPSLRGIALERERLSGEKLCRYPLHRPWTPELLH